MSSYETPLILSQQTSGNFPPKTEDALKSLILNFTDISFFFLFTCLDQANRWLTLPHLSPQVLIIFSDGLDEDVMRLEQESELLRKSSKKINKNKVCSDEIQNWWISGWRSVLHVSRLFLVWVDINALLVVALEGARNPAELQMVEFGRGFGYKLPLSIGMPSVGSTILKQIVSASCHRSLTKPRAVHSHLYLTPAVSKEPSPPRTWHSR